MSKIVQKNRRYFLYSSLNSELKPIYFKQIFNYLRTLVFEYYGFERWYQGLFCSDYRMQEGRDIIICEEDWMIAGISIIKNLNDEKKICTLRVAKEYQHQGIGHHLVEMSFKELQTEKPMITLHKRKLNQFEHLLQYYDFELEQTQKNYYKIFSTELVFNGSLPRKQSIIDRLLIFDMEKAIYQYLYGEKSMNYNEYMQEYLKKWIRNDGIEVGI